MNAVILTSVLSAGNSGMYASTRMLYSMSKDKLAFEAFGKTNKTCAIYVVTCYSNHCSDYFRITKPYKGAYEYIVAAASGLTGFIAW